MTEIAVGMGEVAIGFPGDTLASLGLGSCVAVILHDPVARVAGLAHVMLPDSSSSRIEPLQRTALLADADQGIRRRLRSILDGAGFSVLGESSEKEQTVVLFRRHRPSVSLVSAFLPPASGAVAAEDLFRIDQQANVILISPQTERQIVLGWLSMGIREVITNPFTEEKVVSSLEYVLQRRLLKFADRAVPVLKARLLGLGASERNLVAKIVGGAHMFPSLKDEEVIQIGRRNIEAVKSLLAAHSIAIIAEETGSNVGRTARFDVASGSLMVSTKNGHRSL